MPQRKKNKLTCAYGAFSLLTTIQISLVDSDEIQTYTVSSEMNSFPTEIARLITNLEIKEAVFYGVPEPLKEKITEQLTLFNYDNNKCEVKYI